MYIIASIHFLNIFIISSHSLNIHYFAYYLKKYYNAFTMSTKMLKENYPESNFLFIILTYKGKSFLIDKKWWIDKKYPLFIKESLPPSLPLPLLLSLSLQHINCQYKSLSMQCELFSCFKYQLRSKRATKIKWN